MVGLWLGLGLIQSALSAISFDYETRCFSGPDEIQIDNEQVVKWKKEEKNQFRARSKVSGTIVGEVSDNGSHYHFSIVLDEPEEQEGKKQKNLTLVKKDDPRESRRLEVIYNQSFGDLVDLAEGKRLVVCGDFINSYARSGRYPPSPDGAIIHWVHHNPGNRASSKHHEHGYIWSEEGKLMGFDDATKEMVDSIRGKAIEIEKQDKKKSKKKIRKAA